ncbi:hypothetical protein [Pseudoxanthomonas sp. JBR18]|uniref:hypothetical protein n=1 Tax=Pseudoxanthomonas sp. JBR18 TaxID=2969308 RepID=UPI002304F0D2|nr:hypothetical protein [Pseudoxanthomonas sp. JBR18]WCE05583.1 hypothetical protein PJ250_06410 [Pseudoxanthomonas sp. JBR18]
MRLVAIFLFSLVVGCSGRKPFQPPPDTYERWVKPGESFIDVKKAVMECGYPNPYNALLESDNSRNRAILGANEIILADLCLIGSGYKYHRRDKYDFCVGDKWPACSSSVQPPKRSVKLRLESRFCRDFPAADVCQP